MTITVNGEPTRLDDRATVADLLDRLGLRNRPCAVEVNRALVSKPDHPRRELTEGDAVEVVTLVGGG